VQPKDCEDGSDCMAIILHPNAAAEAKDKPTQHKQQNEHFQQHHHWGQALHYLDHTAVIAPGDMLQLAVQRQGPKMTVTLLGGTAANPPPDHSPGQPGPAARSSDSDTSCKNAEALHLPTAPAPPPAPANTSPDRTTNSTSTSSSRSSSAGSASAVVPLELQPALRPPWLRPGAGIEDPAVWSVTKCRQLLGQMLQRAPGGKFPPIWNDLALMQVGGNWLNISEYLNVVYTNNVVCTLCRVC
jgi:hypothetical protein